MTPETEALIARVRELDATATKGPLKVSTYRPNNVIARDPKESTYETGDDKFASLAYFDRIEDGRVFAFYRTAAPQLATALEAESQRAEFWKTALDAEYARRIDAEKRADELKSCWTDEILAKSELRREVAGLTEALNIANRSADDQMFQKRAAEARADAAEAKLKVAREALEPVLDDILTRHGELFEEENWNPDHQVELSLTVAEVRAIAKLPKTK